MKLFGVVLGERNAKLGDVLNFSLPSVTTCPGASEWCLRHCYARRFERLRPSCRKAYEENLILAQDTERFIMTMTGVIPRIAPSFRIHVSGDFFSNPYVDAWSEICGEFPNTYFWTYTRSWVDADLREHLDRLRSLPNVRLHASTDPTMPLPPEGWPVAFLDVDTRAHGILCYEQAETKDSCSECRYCLRESVGNVTFRVR